MPSGGAVRNFAEEAEFTDHLCLERVSPGKGCVNLVLSKSRVGGRWWWWWGGGGLLHQWLI